MSIAYTGGLRKLKKSNRFFYEFSTGRRLHAAYLQQQITYGPLNRQAAFDVDSIVYDVVLLCMKKSVEKIQSKKLAKITLANPSTYILCSYCKRRMG